MAASTPSEPSRPALPPAPSRPRAGGTPPARRRRERLTPERILDAAIAILDRDGLNAVTVRAVADDLGTGGASLYAHFANKDALIEGLLDRIFAEVPIPERADGRRWKSQAKDLVRAIRTTLGAHRDIARASLGNVPTSPHALEISERLIEILQAGNLSDQTIAFGIDLLALYATATAYEESIFVKDGLTPEDFERWRQEMTRYMASLPADRFPQLIALAPALTAGSIEGDERFTFGLDVIIAGLDAQPKPKGR